MMSNLTFHFSLFFVCLLADYRRMMIISLNQKQICMTRNLIWVNCHWQIYLTHRQQQVTVVTIQISRMLQSEIWIFLLWFFYFVTQPLTWLFFSLFRQVFIVFSASICYMLVHWCCCFREYSVVCISNSLCNSV